jgi:predicted kinase
MKNPPVLYMLVGLPGSGKSTYSEKNLGPALQLARDFFYYSTDYHIDRIAKDHGLTYDDVFEDNIKDATAVMNLFLAEAIKSKRDVIWDQTNLTVNSRRKKLARFPPEYRKVAIVFEVPEDVLNERLAGRPGKTIPPHIISSMRNTYVAPTFDEGFNYIVIIPYDENN